MLFRIFHYLGLFCIVAFSLISIFISSEYKTLSKDNPQSFKYISFISLLEERFFDARMKFSLKDNEVDNRLVFAAIDDQSLLKIGRFPWTRTEYVKLIKKLDTFGAKVIAFDIFFSEPELACNAESPDIALSNAFRDFQNKPGKKIILPYSVERLDRGEAFDSNGKFKTPPDSLLNFMLNTQVQNDKQNLEVLYASKNVFPIERLIDSEVGVAHIEAESDPDGFFRYYPLVANLDGIYYPSFALMSYEYFTGDKPNVIIPSAENAYVEVKKGKIYVNSTGETKVNWLGGMDKFPTVSILDILTAKDSDKKMLEIFNNKLVFVGSRAFGAHDLRNTPVDSMLPGIIFHMNMVHMLLEGKFFIPEEESIRTSILILIISSALMIGIMLLGHAVIDIFAVTSLIVGLFYLDTFFLIPKGYNNKLFFCLYSVFTCYSWSTFLNFYQSNKEKKKIKGTFSRYLAPSIVNDLLKNPEKVKLGGEKKNITVFFSDVRDFTSISEKLTPEQLSLCLNKYMTMMTDTLFEHQGTLDKYIGDAMVAYWGAPVDLENHSYWAVKGAIQMIERLPAINQQFEKEGFPIFKHGIGLNTGECSVGNMGSNQIFSYTALGDNMNLGARLESLCKYYGVQLNISEYTKNAISPELQKEFTFRTLDKVKVKGKENAVTIYEVLHPGHPLYGQHETLEMHENAFQLYLKREFQEAQNTFKVLTDMHPEDKTFLRMFEASKIFFENPPPSDWDGSFTHKNK
jgi:adenylate cyclase